MFTNFRPHFSLGFFPDSPEYPPLTLSFYKDVGYVWQLVSFSHIIRFFLQPFVHSNGYPVEIKFNSILRGYVTSDFEKQNTILTARISSPVLFQEDITQLEDETYWKITYNKGTKAYKIEREAPPPGFY